MDPDSCIRYIREALEEDNHQLALNYAIDLVGWHKRGGYITDDHLDKVVGLLDYLDNFSNPSKNNEIYNLLDGLLEDVHTAKRAQIMSNVAAVDDYAAIARRAREIRRNRE